MGFGEVVEGVGKGIDAAGIGVIVAGAGIATVFYVRHLHRGIRATEAYRAYRESLGRAILLGLEFLVAADIIRTVAISPTFRNVGILAIIVLIRTFLSVALELEIEGRWPWQRRERPTTERERVAASMPAHPDWREPV